MDVKANWGDSSEELSDYCVMNGAWLATARGAVSGSAPCPQTERLY